MTDELELERFPVDATGMGWASFRNTYNDPRGGGRRTHLAADIMAPEGARIVAPVAGRIVRPHLTDEGLTGYGLSLIERRAGVSYLWHFAHMREAPTLREGDRVQAGDLLGYVGASGNATHTDRHGVVHRAYHLHLQVERLPGRERIDPTMALVQVAERDTVPVRYTTADRAVLRFGVPSSRASSRPHAIVERPRDVAPAFVMGGLVLAALYLLSSEPERRRTWRTPSSN